MPLPNNIINQVKALLADIDKAGEAFCHSTGLQCKVGCGACCQKPDIQTTVTEVLPLAQWIIDEKKDEQVLAAITRDDPKGVCVFYQPDKNIPGNGRCGVYDLRPGICRLFAFSAVKDKHNKAQLVTCKIIKEHFPQAVAKAQALIDKGEAVPMLSNHTMNVLSIDPQHGTTLLPINTAVQKAIEILGLHQSFNEGK